MKIEIVERPSSREFENDALILLGTGFKLTHYSAAVSGDTIWHCGVFQLDDEESDAVESAPKGQEGGNA